jgi:small nuclear ribonucleoprotein (snRNP)-like protein
MSGRPLDVLEDSLHDIVTVRLKDGELYRGELGGYDQHMNLTLDPAPEEAEDGDEGATRVRDTTIIRGDNVVSILP